MEKRIIYLSKIVGLICISTFLFPSCATIIGGGTYNAHVKVMDHPKANIAFKGSHRGQGEVGLKVPRKEAGSFSITVVEENCKKQEFSFTEKSFRGWALAGSIFTWTFIVNGFPVPAGVVVDLGTGAYWKPSILEKGVSKIDYKNFSYQIDYTGCDDNEKKTTPVVETKTKRLLELKDLLDKGILTQDEFDAEKKKVLDE